MNDVFLKNGNLNFDFSKYTQLYANDLKNLCQVRSNDVCFLHFCNSDLTFNTKYENMLNLYNQIDTKN